MLMSMFQLYSYFFFSLLFSFQVFIDLSLMTICKSYDLHLAAKCLIIVQNFALCTECRFSNYGVFIRFILKCITRLW